MKLRIATKTHNDIIASCPLEGACQGVQITQGKMITFSCDYYNGTRIDERGLFVRCDFPEPECNN